MDELTTVHGRLIMIDPKVGPLLLIAGSCMHVCIHMTAVFGCFAHVGIAGPKQPCTCLGLNGNLVSLPSPMSARTTCATPPTLRTTPSPASGRHVWVCAADGAHPQPAALCGVRPPGPAGGRQPRAGGLRALPGATAAEQLAGCCSLLEPGLVWAANCWLASLLAGLRVAFSPSPSRPASHPTHSAVHRC